MYFSPFNGTVARENKRARLKRAAYRRTILSGPANAILRALAERSYYAEVRPSSHLDVLEGLGLVRVLAVDNELRARITMDGRSYLARKWSHAALRKALFGRHNQEMKEAEAMNDPTEAARRIQQAEVNAATDEQIAKEGQTWTTARLQEDFEVLGFAAPYVIVRRKSDGVKGSMLFRHDPRIYFGFEAKP